MLKRQKGIHPIDGTTLDKRKPATVVLMDLDVGDIVELLLGEGDHVPTDVDTDRLAASAGYRPEQAPDTTTDFQTRPVPS